LREHRTDLYDLLDQLHTGHDAPGVEEALEAEHYGTPSRFDLVSEIPKGPVVVELIYTQSFAARPLVWKFFAYQGSQRWIIIDTNFNDKTNLLD
jgi:hypothetical protein